MNIQVGQAIAQFSAIGREDPRIVSWKGGSFPHQLAEAECLEQYIRQLEPDPSAALRLAAHCQHLRRYAFPRSDFPPGREGYLAWRKYVALQSANEAADILRGLGLEQSIIDEVVHIVTKRDRKHSAGVQTMEDALCLTFFRIDAPGFAAKHELAEVERIVRRSWLKMSLRGRALAASEAYPVPLHGLLVDLETGVSEAAD